MTTEDTDFDGDSEAKAQGILLTSPSQYQEIEKLCDRKWWWKKVVGLKEPKQAFNLYGTALHSRAERFLLTDPTGRDPQTGESVDLFPRGWALPYQLLPNEVAQIETMIGSAIEQGILYRPSGEYGVEMHYRWDLPGGTRARERGYVDLVEPEVVTDWKTTASLRWALTPEKLHADLQVRSYALELARRRHADGLPLVPITVRHGIFAKDTGKVVERRAVLSPEDLLEHHERVQGVAAKMARLRAVREEAWETIEAPHPGSDACNAYRGCPFRSICTHRESVPEYRARMDRALGTGPATKTPEPPIRAQETYVDLMSILKRPVEPQATQALQVEQPGPPPPAVPFDQPVAINPPAPPPPAAAAPPLVQMILGTVAQDIQRRSTLLAAPRLPENEGPAWLPPPWANPACNACRTNPHPGFNTKNEPCRICTLHAKARGTPEPAEYGIRIVNGRPTWTELPKVPKKVDVASPAAEAFLRRAAEPDPRPAPAQPIETGGIEVPDPDGSVRKMLESATSGTVIPLWPTSAQGGEEVEVGVPVRKGKPGRPKGSKNKPKEGVTEPESSGVIRQEGEVQASVSQPSSTMDRTSTRAPSSLEEQLRASLRPVPGQPQLDPDGKQATLLGRPVIWADPKELGEEAATQPLVFGDYSQHTQEQFKKIIQEAKEVSEKINSEQFSRPAILTPFQQTQVSHPGFFLAVGCRPVAGEFVRSEGLDLAELLAWLAQRLEEKEGKSFYDLNPFDRRDQLCHALGTKECREKLAGKWVTAARGGGPDFEPVLARLRMLAAFVVES